jgi:hypothetical protein
MRSRVESRIAGERIEFRTVCLECGRKSVWHGDLNLAEKIGDKHSAVAHGEKVSA